MSRLDGMAISRGFLGLSRGAGTSRRNGHSEQLPPTRRLRRGIEKRFQPLQVGDLIERGLLGGTGWAKTLLIEFEQELSRCLGCANAFTPRFTPRFTSRLTLLQNLLISRRFAHTHNPP